MKRLLLIAAAVLLFGCLEPAVKLGCCMKANATMNDTDPAQNTCVLYNMTTFLTTDSYADHCPGIGGCTYWCNESAGGCNVSVRVGTGYKDFMIPICSLDQIQPCISGNCTAMVCGDFDFKPRVAPSLTSTDTTDSSGSKTSASLNTGGGTPTDTNEKGGAMQFYNSQCRFLPMDAKLNKIMKNSKSQINVFRMGVGGSFDEFDQYRFFFPMSDQYCNLNPGGRVDRYMNYLAYRSPSLSAYDNPVASISQNCQDDSAILAPFTFSGSTDMKTTWIEAKFPTTRFHSGGLTCFVDNTEYLYLKAYYPRVPDRSDYKRAHYARVDYGFTRNPFFGDYSLFRLGEAPAGGHWYPDLGGSFSDADWNVYKKIDADYYKKYLSIVHANDVYGITGCGAAAETSPSTKASFECDVSANDCYSGSCNTQAYTRSVMLQNAADPRGAREIITDCNKMPDENGQIKVLCAPTTAVSVSCTAGTPPTFTYARADVSSVLKMTYDSNNHEYRWNELFGIGDLSEDDAMDYYWGNMTLSSDYNDMNGNPYPRNGVGNHIITNYSYSVMAQTKANECPDEYPGTDSDTVSPCSNFYESGIGPPVAGAVFFGKTGDNNVVFPEGDEKVIIGYSIAMPGDFQNMLVVNNCNMTEGEDYVLVNLSGRTNANWTSRMETSNWIGLMTAFTPYFETRVKALKSTLSDKCTSSVHWGSSNKLQAMDTVLSSIPWVVSYSKWIARPYDDSDKAGGDDPAGFSWFADYLVSESAQALRTSNRYSGAMNASLGTSSCELRTTSTHENDNGDMTKHIRFVYDIVSSRQIYLFKYAPNSGRIGNCSVDENTRLPVTKTFGWCEPCTTSTLAFQTVTAVDKPYMPGYTANVDRMFATQEETICNAQCASGDTAIYENASCFNKHITDVGDYSGDVAEIGSPRTRPEATIMKERMGDYMKSGVMPVLDLSDASNWNTTSFLTFGATNYTQYDFQRLVGEMGAVIIIVDHVADADDAATRTEEILDRGGIVKDYCFGCLTAFHVNTPLTNQSFNETIWAVFSDPRVAYSIDMVTFDYPVSSHNTMTTPDMVADDIASYGQIALQSANVPTMVVGFNVKSNDGVWNDTNYGDLFGALVTKEDKLIKSGVIGVIYSPARMLDEASLPALGFSGEEEEGWFGWVDILTTQTLYNFFRYRAGTGLVDLDINGLGTKGTKFCAMQGAMYKLSTKAPTAIFGKSASMGETNCSRCSSTDIVLDKCGAPDGHSAPVCDNGEECNLGGLAAAEAKCPDNAITSNCSLCNASSQQYSCTRQYANGTVEEFGGRLSNVTSDLYMDVLAGISKPNKCCIRDAASGTNYTYYKTAYGTPVNKPLVFAKSGANDTDCGFGGSMGDVNRLTSFCSVQQTQFKDYDINCSRFDRQ